MTDTGTETVAREPRPDKVAVVDEVRQRMDAAGATLLTEYRGLNVTAMAELRNALREAGGEMKIYKNTLVRRAVAELSLDDDIDDLLVGPTALAFVDGDAAAVAKALREFAKAHEALVIKGGVLSGRRVGEDDIKALADLPSRETLLSEIAGLFAAPMQQFASLLDAVPRSFVYALQALIDKGGAGTAEAAPAEAPADDAPAEAPAAEAAPAADEAPAPDAATPDETPVAEAADTPATEAETPSSGAEAGTETEEGD